MPELPNITPTDLAAIMRPRKVCLCCDVSRKDLVDAMENGADTFKKLQDQTGCAMGCGTCESAVRNILKDYKRNGP